MYIFSERLSNAFCHDYWKSRKTKCFITRQLLNILKLMWIINYIVDLKEIFLNCVDCLDEYGSFEFKPNHVSFDDIGIYISALSDNAAILGFATYKS